MYFFLLPSFKCLLVSYNDSNCIQILPLSILRKCFVSNRDILTRVTYSKGSFRQTASIPSYLTSPPLSPTCFGCLFRQTASIPSYHTSPPLSSPALVAHPDKPHQSLPTTKALSPASVAHSDKPHQSLPTTKALSPASVAHSDKPHQSLPTTKALSPASVAHSGKPHQSSPPYHTSSLTCFGWFRQTAPIPPYHISPPLSSPASVAHSGKPHQSPPTTLALNSTHLPRLLIQTNRNNPPYHTNPQLNSPASVAHPDKPQQSLPTTLALSPACVAHSDKPHQSSPPPPTTLALSPALVAYSDKPHQPSHLLRLLLLWPLWTCLKRRCSCSRCEGRPAVVPADHHIFSAIVGVNGENVIIHTTPTD